MLAHPYSAGRFEVVVLDNASDDGSVERIARAFPQVRVLEQPVRRGFGANHSIVARAVQSDLVLFLNPDTVMQPGTLDRLVEAFDADPRVVMTGGPIIDPAGGVWRAAPFRFPTPWSATFEAFGLHRLSSEPIAPGGVSVGVGWLSGSALMVDRRVFLAVGGFDPEFFLYFEETDLAKRLTEAGGRIAFDSRAPVVHEGRTTERAIDVDRAVAPTAMKTTTEFERSAVIYMRKHFGALGSTIYRGALLAGAGLRWAATFSPPVARRMASHGGTVAWTRGHHRRRVALAVRPSSGVSIGDAATDWNLGRTHAHTSP